MQIEDIKKLTLWQVNEIVYHKTDSETGAIEFQFEDDRPDVSEHDLFVQKQMERGLSKKEAELLWVEGNERKKFLVKLEQEFKKRHDATLDLYTLALERESMPSDERRRLINAKRDQIWDEGAKEYNDRVAAFRREQLLRREKGRM
jgi:hypothetical protein